MPFYYVQIAPFSGPKYLEGELPALWEAQVATLKLPHTGMAVITDLVDKINDIHPIDKQPVGDRLALGALTEFEIAGADGKFVAAEAKIDGEAVMVFAAGANAPKAVRFAWHKTANLNLVNAAGLPASPFQTDDWTGGTGE